MKRGQVAGIALGVSLGVSLLLGGCARGGRGSIASGARTVKAGQGTVEYTATRSGTVYVLDADTDKLYALATVRAGQTVRVDADADRITVDAKVINERPIAPNHRHEIRFRADEERSDR
jgi:hypothetical protein